MAIMLATMPGMGKSKRGPGRPKKNRETDTVSGRVTVEVKAALEALADLHRRSMSVEVGISVERIVLNAEAELREAGLWTAQLDKLKAEYRPS